MEFSNPGQNSGIVQEIDFLLGLDDSATYPIAHKTRNINRGLDRVAALIMQADSRWQWDDTNYTNEPIGKINLVSGQRKYGIDFIWLRIVKVLVKDKTGNWQVLEPVDEQDLEGQDIIRERLEGVPKRYIKKGNNIYLGPEPDYSSTNGLMFHFQRNVDYFVSGDTDKKPGFAEPFHRLLSLYAAYDYCLANNLAGRMAIFSNEIAKLEVALMEFYSQRARDEKPRLSLRKEDYGQRYLT